MALDMRQMAAAALEAAVEDDEPQGRAQKGHLALRGIAAGLLVGGAARIALKRTSTVRQLGGALKMANRLREAPERLRDTVADGVADLRERIADFDFGESSPAEEAGGVGLTDEEPEAEEEPEEADESEEEPEEAEGGEPAAESEPGGEDEEPEEAEDEQPEEANPGPEAEAEEAERPDDEDEDDEEGNSDRPTLGGAETVDALVADESGNGPSARSETPDVLSLLSAEREPPPILERLVGERPASPTRRPPVASESGSKRRSRARKGRSRAGTP